MDNTNIEDKAKLLAKAQSGMLEDMKARQIGAIIWDNTRAGFHYLPEISISDGDKTETVNITGLYACNNTLYLIEEGEKAAEISNFYTEGVEVAPTVVTLSPNSAESIFGNPEKNRKFSTGGTLEEWLVIADCYFEALAEA